MHFRYLKDTTAIVGLFQKDLVFYFQKYQKIGNIFEDLSLYPEDRAVKGNCVL